MRSPELRVLRQLVEALLFEGLVPSERTAGADGRVRFRLRLGELALVATGRVSGFGRVRLEEDSIRHLQVDGTDAPVDLIALVQALPAEMSVREALAAELAQTIKLCDWNHQHLNPAQSRRTLDHEALESAIDEGHLYHPCFKARLGFTLDDHQAYGPEAANGFQLHWLAVHRSQLRASLPLLEEDFWLCEVGPRTWDQLCTQLHAQDGELRDYSVMPLHPWQWQHLQQQALQPAMARGDLLYLGAAGDQYAANQSLRTLRNLTRPHQAHVKLPLNVINTSAVRALASHSVCSAPAISRWLAKLVRADAYLKRSGLVILKEYAGALYCPASPEEAQALAGQVGAIWRESLQSHLRTGEQAVPMTALMVTEVDGKPFIDGWISRIGVATWVERLIEVAVLPVWHLLAQQGVAVEAHAQNMVLIHRDGWPERVALRDFHESLEYVESYLARPELKPDFVRLNPLYRDAPDDRYYWMASVEALRELVMDTLFVFNLAELSFLLETHYGWPEALFWRQVRQQLDQHARAHKIAPERWAALGIDAPMIRAESLLTKKLSRQPGQ